MENLENQLLKQRHTSRNFFWHRLRWNAIRPALVKENVKSVVDLGAGSGIFADFVKTEIRDVDYFFVEPSSLLTPYLEKEFGKDHNLTTAPNFKNMDAVIALDVLEHIENDADFLKQVASKMRSGAVLAMTVPSMKLLWSRWDLRVGHYRRYERSDLKKLFRDLSLEFELTDLRYLFWELFPMGLYRKWKMRSLDTSQGSPLQEAEVPILPGWINETLYWYGYFAMLASKWMPIGTTLMLTARKR